jgi:hypothetical protein
MGGSLSRGDRPSWQCACWPPTWQVPPGTSGARLKYPDVHWMHSSRVSALVISPSRHERTSTSTCTAAAACVRARVSGGSVRGRRQAHVHQTRRCRLTERNTPESAMRGARPLQCVGLVPSPECLKYPPRPCPTPQHSLCLAAPAMPGEPPSTEAMGCPGPSLPMWVRCQGRVLNP